MDAPKVPYSFSMLGWALNEEDNIASYIEKAEGFLSSITDDYELILIDDGCTDRTFEIACEFQRTRPWLRLYRNERNRGSGYNAKYAISLAQKDYLFWQTVDWAYDLTQVRLRLDLLSRFDILQGVRVSTRTGHANLSVWRSDNIYKAFISSVNFILVRLLFRMPLSDYQNVTVYPRELIQAIPLESESAFTNPECLLKTWWLGSSFAEVPVAFIKRTKGKAKGTHLKVVLKSSTEVFYWWFRWIVLGQRKFIHKGLIRRWYEDSSPK